MMNSKKKIVIAAMLAAVMGLTGCNANREPANSVPYNYSSTQESTVSETSSSAASSSTTTSSEPVETSSTAQPVETSESTTKSKPVESDAADSDDWYNYEIDWNRPTGDMNLDKYTFKSYIENGTYEDLCASYGITVKKGKKPDDEYKPGDGNIIIPTLPITRTPDPDCENCGWKTQHVYITMPTEDEIGEVGMQCVKCGFTIDEGYAIYYDDECYTSKEYAEDAHKKKKADRAADKIIKEIGLNEGEKSDLEKLILLNKWFYDNTKYDATYERHSACDILVDRLGVCSSYAEALSIILPKCGIETYYCVADSINHAWNLVKIDGQWTYTDFTGGLDSNPTEIILGSSCHGVPADIKVKEYNVDEYMMRGISFDLSTVSTKLRLIDFNENDLEVHEESDGFSYVDSNGQGWKCTF